MAIEQTDLIIVNRAGLDYRSYVSELNIPTKISDLDDDAGLGGIPTHVSELINDVPYAEVDDIPTDNAQLLNGAGYLLAVDLPTDLSEFNNDVPYALLSEVPTDNADLLNGAGYITEDDIAGLNQALVFKGVIDATSSYPADPIEVGDVWVNDTTGTADSRWTGLTNVTDGDMIARGSTQWVVIGASQIPDLTPYVEKAGSNMTGNLTFATNKIVLNAAGSASFELKATSALTIAADADSTLTTKSYVDDLLIEVDNGAYTY